jgi:hypothetical protein
MCLGVRALEQVMQPASKQKRKDRGCRFAAPVMCLGVGALEQVMQPASKQKVKTEAIGLRHL